MLWVLIDRRGAHCAFTVGVLCHVPLKVCILFRPVRTERTREGLFVRVGAKMTEHVARVERLVLAECALLLGEGPGTDDGDGVWQRGVATYRIYRVVYSTRARMTQHSAAMALGFLGDREGTEPLIVVYERQSLPCLIW